MDSVLTGEIVRKIRTDEFVYVGDRNALFKFGNEGKIVASLRKSGFGPDEYANIWENLIGIKYKRLLLR